MAFPSRKRKRDCKKFSLFLKRIIRSMFSKNGRKSLTITRRKTRSTKSFVGDRSIHSWEDIPVMQKAHLQHPLKERLSNDYKESNVYVNKTSGSSGHPFIFAKDRFCHALTWAEILDRFGWYNLDFHRSYQARFYGIPLGVYGLSKRTF